MMAWIFPQAVELTQTPPESLLEIMAICTTEAHIGEMTAGSYWLKGFSLL
jgi:hypothetical protein